VLNFHDSLVQKGPEKEGLIGRLFLCVQQPRRAREPGRPLFNAQAEDAQHQGPGLEGDQA
jgi:hypothetical protein